MSEIQHCVLTTKDHAIVEVMLQRCLGREDPLARLLSDKLSHATVMFREDIPPSVVTLNSRVRFRIDANPAETRILVHDDLGGAVGMTLPLRSRRGLALLGMMEGESTTVEAAGGAETLSVVEVLYQPEAARREASRLRAASRPGLRLVHSSHDTGHDAGHDAELRPAGRGFPMSWPAPDDPGPSAA